MLFYAIGHCNCVGFRSVRENRNCLPGFEDNWQKILAAIQQIRDILKESAASSRVSENFDTSNGRVTEN